VSHALVEWCELLSNIHGIVAGGRSWATGIVGLHQHIFRDMLAMPRASTKMSAKQLMLWCRVANHEMVMVIGHSPNQWVLGTSTMMMNPVSHEHVRLPELGDGDAFGIRVFGHDGRPQRSSNGNGCG